MLTKEAKIRILEAFYGLDEIFFGKNATELNVCCPFFIENYMQIKGAFLSIVAEMYDKINVNPPIIQEKVDSKKLIKRAKKVAKVVRESAARILKTKRGKQEIKREVISALRESEENVNASKMIEEKIKEKSFTLAVDNFVLARALTESTNYKYLDTYEGKILENSYKVLRDSLVEAAMDVLNLAEESDD
ncbi:MAG: hypothetical protein KatS3mg002_0454 [Candidatus Woesearchaeota archaeon]|nr:MAG: hypothetical protein KatS3mg002_0454 [Candidatus Woesearchaeota archaeon]